MTKFMKALLDYAAGREEVRPVPIRRASQIFPDGRTRPAYCHADRSRHREHHHYYEDMLM